MLDDVFDRAQVCRRMRTGLGTVLDDLSNHLISRGLGEERCSSIFARLSIFCVGYIAEPDDTVSSN